MRPLVPRDVLDAPQAGRPSTRSAAVLVVDVAGSTSLSATLQEFGTAGAEALADLLSAVFGPIVDIVYDHGGFVGHFTGDGLHAIFPGAVDLAVDAATAAAVRIAEELAVLDRAPTPAGPLRLEVRAAIGAGSVERRIWRRGHGRQDAAFAYLGPALCEAQEGEKLADPGEIVVGPTARQASGADIGWYGRRGAHAVLAPGSFSPRPAVGQVPGRAVPHGLRFHPDDVARLAIRGEFRDVVSAFVTLRSIDPGDDRIADLIPIVVRHGGYLNNLLRAQPDDEGITALLVWGAPRSTERDLPRAVACLESIRRLAGDGSMRAGITRGVVFTGFVGSGRQETYTAVGAAVNLAARLGSSAEWGQVRSDDSIRRDLPADWEMRGAGSRTYKGFDTTVDTYTLHPGRSHRPERAPEIVGRHDELRTMAEAWEPLRSGRAGGTLLVTGDAGTGKTTIVRRLRDDLPDRGIEPLWLESTIDPAFARPLGAVADALAPLIGSRGDPQLGARLDRCLEELAERWPDARPDLARIRPALGDLVDLRDDVDAAASLDPETRFQNVRLAVETLLELTCRTRPVVLAIGSAEHVDGSSREILRRLPRSLSDRPIAIVLESRDETLGELAAVVIRLRSFGARDITELIAVTAGAPPSHRLVELVEERSLGNPYFATEIISSFLRDRSLVDTPDGLDRQSGNEEMPASLRHLLVARLDEMPEPVGRTLQIAAVLGRDFDTASLDELIADRGRVRDDLAAAADADLVDHLDARRMAFRHSLLRDAAYEMQLHSEVRDLHRRAADAIRHVEPDPEVRAAEIASHYDRGEVGPEAHRWFVVAADRAAARFANDDALALLDRARPHASTAGRVREVLRRRHALHDLVGDRAAQDADIEEFDDLTGDDPLLCAELALMRSSICSERGDFERAVVLLEPALAALPESADVDTARLRARLLHRSCEAHRRLGDADRARELAERCQTLLTDVGETGLLARVVDLLGGLAWDSGDFDEAVRQHRTAVELAHEAGDPACEVSSMNNLGTALFGLGNYSAARDIHEEGVRRSREIGIRTAEASHRDNLGGTAWAVGRYDEAIGHYRGALDLRRAIEDAAFEAISLSNLGAAHRALGRLPDAGRFFEQALELDRVTGRRRGAAYNLHGLGQVRRAEGRRDEATELLTEAIDIRRELGEAHLANESRIARAGLFAASGDREKARAEALAVLSEEPRPPFVRCVEPAAAALDAGDALGPASSEARRVRADVAAWLRATAERIDALDQRVSYLENVDAHRRLLASVDGERSG